MNQPVAATELLNDLVCNCRQTPVVLNAWALKTTSFVWQHVTVGACTHLMQQKNLLHVEILWHAALHDSEYDGESDDM